MQNNIYINLSLLYNELQGSRFLIRYREEFLKTPQNESQLSETGPILQKSFEFLEKEFQKFKIFSGNVGFRLRVLV